MKRLRDRRWSKKCYRKFQHTDFRVTHKWLKVLQNSSMIFGNMLREKRKCVEKQSKSQHQNKSLSVFFDFGLFFFFALRVLVPLDGESCYTTLPQHIKKLMSTNRASVGLACHIPHCSAGSLVCQWILEPCGVRSLFVCLFVFTNTNIKAHLWEMSNSTTSSCKGYHLQGLSYKDNKPCWDVRQNN